MFYNKRVLFQIKEKTQQHGIKVGSQTLLKDLSVPSISREGELPSKGPLLIISNHPGVFDSLLLFSQIERDDLFFIALSTYGVFGPKVQERLLPLYRVRRLNHKVYEYPLCLQTDEKPIENLKPPEIRLRNRETIRKAADLINNGRAVSIFPTGEAGKSLDGIKWKAGVGFLIKQITHPKTRVVFTSIHGTRNSDLTALMHPIIRKLFYKPRPILIRFSKSKLLHELIDSTHDGKMIARRLEYQYNNYWA